jgi:hypothetical protein
MLSAGVAGAAGVSADCACAANEAPSVSGNAAQTKARRTAEYKGRKRGETVTVLDMAITNPESNCFFDVITARYAIGVADA